jgi:hypothetical protein
MYHQPPNPRLQRTPLRAPLSRQPFGGFAKTGYLAFFKCQSHYSGKKRRINHGEDLYL